MKMVQCAGCDRPILDRFLLNVLDRSWHTKCVQCCDCKCNLTEKCFSRDGKIYCRNDFFKRYGTKCAGCCQGISPTDLVRRARNKVFHLKCFTCMVCRKQLSTGEELYVIDENRFICKEDYLNSRYNQVLTANSPLDTKELDDQVDSQLELDCHDTERESSVERDSDLSGALSSIVAASPINSSTTSNGSTGSGGGTPTTNSNKSDKSIQQNDENQPGTKRRGPRTTIKAKQLETLKAAFAATPKPTRHIREQLAQETGLNMRVIQVWFQNRRSKERRMKQLSSLGARRHFFRSPRRAMRPLRPGMSPDGLDDSPEIVASTNSGFAYFSGFYDFFPGQHPSDGLPFPPNINAGSAPNSHSSAPTIDQQLSTVGTGLPSEASYLAGGHEMMTQRASPEGVLGLSGTEQYTNQRSSSENSYPTLSHAPPPISETSVW